MIIKGAKVHTSHEKDVGTVTKVDREYFTSYKKGIITDKEYRIPLHSMLKIKYGIIDYPSYQDRRSTSTRLHDRRKS